MLWNGLGDDVKLEHYVVAGAPYGGPIGVDNWIAFPFLKLSRISRRVL